MARARPLARCKATRAFPPSTPPLLFRRGSKRLGTRLTALPSRRKTSKARRESGTGVSDCAGAGKSSNRLRVDADRKFSVSARGSRPNFW